MLLPQLVPVYPPPQPPNIASFNTELTIISENAAVNQAVHVRVTEGYGYTMHTVQYARPSTLAYRAPTSAF